MTDSKQSTTVVINAKHADSVPLAHRIESASTKLGITATIIHRESLEGVNSYRNKHLCCIDLHTYRDMADRMTDQIVVQYAWKSGTSNDLANNIVNRLNDNNYPSQKLENNSNVPQPLEFTKRITRMYQTPTVRVSMRKQATNISHYSKHQIDQIATKIAEAINAFVQQRCTPKNAAFGDTANKLEKTQSEFGKLAKLIKQYEQERYLLNRRYAKIFIGIVVFFAIAATFFALTGCDDTETDTAVEVDAEMIKDINRRSNNTEEN